MRDHRARQDRLLVVRLQRGDDVNVLSAVVAAGRKWMGGVGVERWHGWVVWGGTEV